jgi:pimeloyl-ACP methyl ester carboxylesterase
MLSLSVEEMHMTIVTRASLMELEAPHPSRGAGAGHNVPQEAPEAFAAAVMELIRA